jgi:hypothetical protein
MYRRIFPGTCKEYEKKMGPLRFELRTSAV